MDVLVVTESFLPQVNGVTNSVRRTLEHLGSRGHRATLVAPTGPDIYAGARVRRVPRVAFPGYRDFPLGVVSQRRLRWLLERDRPDVVHLASPAVLGHQALFAARDLGVPTVAVYQTDLIGFADRYAVPGGPAVMRALTGRIHGAADLNLVPSRASHRQLSDLGVGRLAMWGRGVDTAQFHPGRRGEALRTEIGAADGDLVVGYVGRLAAEKELELLEPLSRLPGVRVVLVGGGPEGPRLRRQLPATRFLGVRHGDDLARIVASLDVFVHTGRTETFCQSVQEALASGVPVLAPAQGGPVDLVRPGENGYLFAPGSAIELREYAAVLAEDRWLRHRLAQGAVASVAGRSWSDVGDQLLRHYDAVRPTARPVRRRGTA